MPLPKLSGILNNCALHALTPEIIEEIISFGHAVDYDNGFKAEYELLKRKFSEFYVINNELSWQDFSRIIKTYNALDIQIIFGPVLREYMKDKMQSDIDNVVILSAGNDDLSHEEYIHQMTSIHHETKRYNTLSIQEIECFIGRYLGFNFQQHKNARITKIGLIEKPIKIIDMYHTGAQPSDEHWERMDPNALTDSASTYELENSKLEYIISIINEGDTIDEGIDLLKKHVLATFNNAPKEINRINVSAQQIDFINRALLNIPYKTMIRYIDNDELSIEAQSFLSTKKNNTTIGLFNMQQIQQTLKIFPKLPIQEELKTNYQMIKSKLSHFKKKLNGIGKHHQNARNIAENLYQNLNKLTRQTFQNREPLEIEIEEYKNQVSNFINLALPELERDLGWGDYLKNLCNEIIKMLTAGYYQGFFSAKKSKAAEEVEKLREPLKKQL